MSGIALFVSSCVFSENIGIVGQVSHRVFKMCSLLLTEHCLHS